MDYKVIIPFIYTPTGKGYNEGSTFTIDDGERALALVEKGYLKASGVHANAKQSSNILNDQQTTSQQLKDKAKALKIKGYTKMSDEQLQEAIAKEEAQKARD